MPYHHRTETHGVHPVYDPALDDGGGLGAQLQRGGTGAPNIQNAPGAQSPLCPRTATC